MQKINSLCLQDRQYLESIDFQDHGAGIYSFDAHYMRPGKVSLLMMVHRGKVTFFDTGTSKNMPAVLKVLAILGLPTDAVDYVILTHIHLDHAAGAGVMMKHFENAKLLVHERGAHHMADPSKLIGSARQVYDEASFNEWYAGVLPVDQARINSIVDGDEIDLAGRRLSFYDTPGHARHHLSVFDEQTSSLFAGDAYGISYRSFDTDDHFFIYPATTPNQFDPIAMKESIERLTSLNPSVIYLTHYGRIMPSKKAAQDLLDMIAIFVKIAQTHEKKDQPNEEIKQDLELIFMDRLQGMGHQLTLDKMRLCLGKDIDLNAQGLALWLKRRSA